LLSSTEGGTEGGVGAGEAAGEAGGGEFRAFSRNVATFSRERASQGKLCFFRNEYAAASGDSVAHEVQMIE
jgi:hypothetical protein